MTSESLRKRLGKNIRAARKAKGLTQEALAEATGISFQAINDIECARHWLRDENLVKIAKILEVDPSQLFAPENSEIQDADKSVIARAKDEVIAVLAKYC